MAKKEAPEKGTPEWWKEFENQVHNDPATSAYSPEMIDPRVLKRILCEGIDRLSQDAQNGTKEGEPEEIKYGT